MKKFSFAKGLLKKVKKILITVRKWIAVRLLTFALFLDNHLLDEILNSDNTDAGRGQKLEDSKQEKKEKPAGGLLFKRLQISCKRVVRVRRGALAFLKVRVNRRAYS